MNAAHASPPRSRRPRTALAALLGILSALPSCNQGPTATNAPPPSSISIQAGTSGSGPSKGVTLGLGDTVRIAYVVSDFLGHATSGSPTFITRDARVVTVSTRGLLRAQGSGGAYVVAYVLTSGGKFASDSLKVNVNAPVCTAVAKAGLVIAVEDSLTGSRGPFVTVSYLAKDTSAYKDSTLIANVPAQVGGSLFLVGLAYEHTGKFDVTVKAPNYKPWVKTGVTVLKDECHVIPVSLTARLVP